MIYNWPAAFTAFCTGTDYDEISTVFGIPITTLRSKASNEKWPALREKVHSHAVALWNSEHEVPAVSESGEAPTSRSAVIIPDKVEAKLELIARNREENFRVACELRDHLMEQVKKLKDGSLILEKVFNGKEGISRADVSPGPGDWVNIATYARTIAEISYRALGDVQVTEHRSTGAGANALGAGGAGGSVPAITIILPGAIAAPRAEREAKQAEVIDLRDVPAASDQNPPPETAG
jgi:hypothetical protein